MKLKEGHTSFDGMRVHFLSSISLPDPQKFVVNQGKHIACGEQHVLITHTDVLDAHVYVILLHGSRIEHKTAGAQMLLFIFVR